MLLLNLAVFASLASGIFAVPSPNGHVLHEKRETQSGAWSRVEKLENNVLLPMRIGLVQSNLHRSNELLMEVAHHSSERYGKWYTEAEITELFAPPQAAVDAVRSWLISAGVSPERISQSKNKQWLQFDAETREAEVLFKTEYHVYQHQGTGRTNIACDEYHIPAHVRDHIDYITPGIKLAKHSGLSAPKSTLRRIKKRLTKVAPGRKPGAPPMIKMPATTFKQMVDSGLAMCGFAATPPCIQKMYNITQGTKATAGNELGIFEDLGDIYSQEDLDQFFTALYPQIPNSTHPTLNAVDGAQAPAPVNQAGPESSLDFQIAYPIHWPQQSILFQTDDPVYEANYNFSGFLNNFFDAVDGSYCTFSADGETGNSVLDPSYPNPDPKGFQGQLQCGIYKPTNVISISYGGSEADLPVSYQRRQCTEIMKLGMRGVSVIVASGDHGVSSVPGDVNDDGCLGSGQIFNPDFPSTCPYITSVGSTFLPAGANVNTDSEVATSRFPSGGGFSNIYSRSDEAAWQSKAVDGYLAKKLINFASYQTVDNKSIGTNGGIFNSVGRAYPDLAAVGDNVAIFVQGGPALIGGTSAATPVFAAILTRINEERLAAKKSTVGFVNPVLYQHPEVFNDIVKGNNSGCNTDGFVAGPGWDPVTGLGTPNYPEMLKLFMSLP